MEGHILDQQLLVKSGTDERNKDFNFYNIVIYNIILYIFIMILTLPITSPQK